MDFSPCSQRVVRLPSQPQGPVFEEPWQAHAFAIVMKLYHEGHYTWPDWDDYLGHEIQSPDHFPNLPEGTAPKPEPSVADRANYNQFLAACEADGARYYHHWLAGLEKMLHVKGLVSQDELAHRMAAIAKVEADGPGARAGLERGAVILRVDDQQPESLVALARNIHNRKPGATVKLGVVWEIRRGAFLQRRAVIATVKIR